MIIYIFFFCERSDGKFLIRWKTWVTRDGRLGYKIGLGWVTRDGRLGYKIQSGKEEMEGWVTRLNFSYER